MASSNPSQQSIHLEPQFTAQYPDSFLSKRLSQNIVGRAKYEYPNALAQPHYENNKATAELPAPFPSASHSIKLSDKGEKAAQTISHRSFCEAESNINSPPSQHHPSEHLGPPFDRLSRVDMHGQHQQDLSLDSRQSTPIHVSTLPEVVLDPLSMPEVVPAPHKTSIETSIETSLLQPSPTAHLPPAPTELTALSAYLEVHHQIPYPPQWNLPPVTSTFHSSCIPRPDSDWCDVLESQIWRLDLADHSAAPAFQISFKSRQGNFLRGPKLHWTLTCNSTSREPNGRASTWMYDLKRDAHTGIRRTEALISSKTHELLPTYVRGLNYDSLRFIGLDGRRYLWVSQRSVSSINGSRYDVLRHALFVGDNDPLYGQIIADHAYWDGTANAGEVLHVRSTTVDIGLVVATLQILKDWEFTTLREEKKRHPEAFKQSEELAHAGLLGRMKYWKADDFKGEKPHEIRARISASWEISEQLVPNLSEMSGL